MILEYLFKFHLRETKSHRHYPTFGSHFLIYWCDTCMMTSLAKAHNVPPAVWLKGFVQHLPFLYYFTTNNGSTGIIRLSVTGRYISSLGLVQGATSQSDGAQAPSCSLLPPWHIAKAALIPDFFARVWKFKVCKIDILYHQEVIYMYAYMLLSHEILPHVNHASLLFATAIPISPVHFHEIY